MPVMAIECLDLLSAIRKVEAAVCEHPVHIEDYDTNLSGFFQYVLHRYYIAEMNLEVSDRGWYQVRSCID